MPILLICGFDFIIFINDSDHDGLSDAIKDNWRAQVANLDAVYFIRQFVDSPIHIR